MNRLRLLGLLLFPLLTACTALKPAQAPDVVIPNAHIGGSIVVFNQGSTQLASGGWEGDIELWGLPDGKLLRQWRAHAGTVNGIVFLEADRRILSAGYDGELVEWDAQGHALRRVSAAGPVTAMVANERDNLVVTGHSDGAVRLWRLDDLTLQHEYRPHDSPIRAVAYAPGRGFVAASDMATRVVLWRDLAQAPEELPGPSSDSRALQFSPDGQWLMGSGWFRLFRWRVADDVLTILPTEHNGIIKSIQYNPDGRYLASISRQTDSSVYFLDPMTGAVLRRFQRHDLCGGWIALSPDERYLATTSDDASVRIWRLTPVKKETAQRKGAKTQRSQRNSG